jgi:hypothetical protein
VIAPLDRVAPPVIRELRASPHLRAVRLGAVEALADARADQFALEFRRPDPN